MNDSQPITAACNVPDALLLARQLTASERDDFGAILAEVIDFARREGRVSLASLQEHFDIGHCRAIRIADALERLGVIPPQLLKRRRARWEGLAA